MTDQELLEKAAKVAGIVLVWNDHGAPGYYSSWRGLPQWEDWNPLTDDGDALRLAVQFGMTVNIEQDLKYVCATAGWIPDQPFPRGIATVSLKNDPFKATRRAIVEAASRVKD